MMCRRLKAGDTTWIVCGGVPPEKGDLVEGMAQRSVNVKRGPAGSQPDPDKPKRRRKRKVPNEQLELFS